MTATSAPSLLMNSNRTGLVEERECVCVRVCVCAYTLMLGEKRVLDLLTLDLQGVMSCELPDRGSSGIAASTIKC